MIIPDIIDNFNINEFFTRTIRYLVEGTAVAVAAFYIPRTKLDIHEIIMIAITAASIFSILDIYAPGISSYARQGVGYGIGATITGTNVKKLVPFS